MNSDEHDERYNFQGFEADFLVGLGRVVVGGSYLEGTAAVLLSRLIDNNHLAVGHRITANATFPWLLDHIRAMSELRLPSGDHAAVKAWLGRAQIAYDRRSRLIHADLGIDATGDEPFWIFMRRSARKREFTTEDWPATAEEVHGVAQELERVGLEGLELMDRIPHGWPEVGQ